MPDRLLNIPAILERDVSDVASVFDALGARIYCVDLHGRFTYINSTGQGLLRWGIEELLGQTIFRGRGSSGCSGGQIGVDRLPGVGH
jgi:PAS domain-containing protein